MVKIASDDGSSIAFAIPGDIVPWGREPVAVGTCASLPRRSVPTMATIRTIAADAMAGRPLMDRPVELIVTATWQWPRAMSAKKRALPYADRKTTRPDAGNTVKLVEDAMNARSYGPTMRECPIRTSTSGSAMCQA